MRFSQLLAVIYASLPAVVNGFNNPIIWEDLADLDIRNVNGTYYYSASTMHFSPGAPILRSYDLFNWEYIGHSVPTLAFGDKYNMANGNRAYVGGVWASFFGFHPQKNTWFWGGCIDFYESYIYSAPSVTGPWTQLTSFNKCYYDCGLLVDDDGTMYVSYSTNNQIWVAQLSSDAKSEVKSQMVWDPASYGLGYTEGTRFYKRNGLYYILTDHPSTIEYVLKASTPFGAYSYKTLVSNVSPPATVPIAGAPHQGGIVEAQSGQWYYMAFVDMYPGGRIPVLAPISWGSDDFPTISLTNNQWASSYPDPASAHPMPSLTGVDYFTSIGPQWEWNHNPDTTKYSLSNGIVLQTATVTFDLYSARNTLTHRILGPISTATIKLNYASMIDGDRAGLVVLRDQSAWVGVKRDSGSYSVCMVTGINMGAGWTTISTGTTSASVPISGSSIWLRSTANIDPTSSHTATFSFSTDGSTFTSIGTPLTMNTTWNFFMGYRFGIFNYGTLNLGGHVTIAQFQLDSGMGSTPSGTPATTIQATTTTTTANHITTSKTMITTTASTTTSIKSSTASSTTGTAPHWAQCGGLSYTGPTTCASPYTCQYSNPYYSQCL